MQVNDVGIVAIGRNEGDRLRLCLSSVAETRCGAIIYVDSGSADGSVSMARQMRAEIVELDMSLPFSAGRARNAGFERLAQIRPDVKFVQFVDGDCELVAGWLETALQTFESDPALAVVCGRRRERYPDRSIYNYLADIEWDTPSGEAKSCGGDALMRAEAFRQIGGFNPIMIAGEEPELCLRLRRNGWKVMRIGAEMTLHDAAIKECRQWWRRMVRGGHAYAEGAWMHGSGPERHCVRSVQAILIWAVAIPAAALVLAWTLPLGAAGVLALYPTQTLRIARRERLRHNLTVRVAGAYAIALVLGKFAEAQGAITFWSRRLRGRSGRLIEYKIPGNLSAK